MLYCHTRIQIIYIRCDLFKRYYNIIIVLQDPLDSIRGRNFKSDRRRMLLFKMLFRRFVVKMVGLGIENDGIRTLLQRGLLFKKKFFGANSERKIMVYAFEKDSDRRVEL